MAMIQSECVEVASSERRVLHLSGSPNLANGASSALYSPNSSNTNSYCSENSSSVRSPWNTNIQDVDVNTSNIHEEAKESNNPLCGGNFANGSTTVNPIIKTGSDNEIAGFHRGSSSVSGPLLDESELAIYDSDLMDSGTMTENCSTRGEEELSPVNRPSVKTCAEDFTLAESLSCEELGEEYFQPPDDVLYQPESDRDQIEENPFSLGMQGNNFNINQCERVHIGPVLNFSMSPSKDPSDTGCSKSMHTKKAQEVNEATNSSVNITIKTAPVQTLPQHHIINKTQSVPVKPQPLEIRDNNPRLPRHPPTLSQADTSQLHRTSGFENMITPPASASPGNYTADLQISFVGPPHFQREDALPRNNPNLEKVLSEAQDDLVLTYKRQTKTSFLPWLKGRQIIHMDEFYIEPRILEVDKQGKQMRQTVDLVQMLTQDNEETRFLVEGELGMGKTLLAHKLAIDWANKMSLGEFKFVFLILMRDFKESLEKYIRGELLSSLSDEKFSKVWEFCKNNDEQVLFILDGYDELEKSEESKIRKLIEGRDFHRSNVVVTSRPEVLRTSAKRIIVKGFNEAQMFEFIGKYFKLYNEDTSGRSMKRVIEKDYKYRKLAKRPLFCVFLCMLYGSDVVSKLPERLSELMFNIMLCLIKWNNKEVGHVDENTEAFPLEYNELFLSFGRLCLQALKTDKTRFSEKEILDMKGVFDPNLLLQLGFLSTDSENYIFGTRKFWKPVHKIFLEYLAGLYIANHINKDCRDCRECRDFSKIYRNEHEHVLQFVVGTLDKKAYLALDGRRHPSFLQMKDLDLLMLLREAGPTKDNCRAVAKLLDQNYATVYTSEAHFEGWGSILDQNFRKLKALEIVWRIKSNNPDQESSFSEANPDLYKTFFNSLKHNKSINSIKIRATQDGEPFSKQKIELFFSNLEKVLLKENLRELEIKELKMPVSKHLRKAIEGATCHMDKKALGFMERLRLDMFIDDEDLAVLSERLKLCAPNLKELQLTGLVIGSHGFNKLAELLRKNKNLQKLHISMDKANLQPNSGVFLSKYGNSYTPSVMQTDQKRMNRTAVKESKRAHNEQRASIEFLDHGNADVATLPDDTAVGMASKSSNSKGLRKHFMNSVSLERLHQQHYNSKEYYTQEEVDNFQNLGEEDNVSKDHQRLTVSPHCLITKESEEDDSHCTISLPKSNRSPRLSGDRPHPSPGNAATCDERRVSVAMKDPTKELNYLFQDPFNSGIKTSYQANHYSFIKGADGENLPLPLCSDREHKSVFHELFSALPESNIKYLNLDYPCLYLSTYDLVCLGDAIRKTKYLSTLKLQNLKSAKKYIPVLLGLGQSQSLITVILESNDVVITDSVFVHICTALRNNTTLKSLSLARWEFNIQDEATAIRYFRDLLSNWKVIDLNLASCTIDTGFGMALTSPLCPLPIVLPIQTPVRSWSCIKTLRLPNVKLKESPAVEQRGHLLLPLLRYCPSLTVLDLSASDNQQIYLDDNSLRTFFQRLGTDFKKLRELTMCNWELRFKQYEETCSEIGSLVKSCAELRTLVLDKVSEVRSGLSISTPCKKTFLHQLVNNLPRLAELSLCCYRIDNYEFDRDSASHLGQCFHDHWCSSTKFKLKFFGLTHEVESSLLESLKKDNFSVVTSSGYPLEITVKKRYILSA